MGGGGLALKPFEPLALQEYARCLALPGAAHGLCEDYRATHTVDLDMDAADFETAQARQILVTRVDAGSPADGIIAVAETARGRGVGRALVEAAHNQYLQWGLDSAHVVTQLRNIQAQRLYQSNGYRIVSASHWYHHWL